MREKLVLIDGHSILNRAFYGIPDLSNAEGLHTNAIYGFLNIMFKIIEEENPSFLAVAFDLKAPTFRHKIYPEYKGTRKGMPDELREQVPIMKEVLQAMGILIMEKEGLEADDILGTFAKKAQGQGLEIALVSGDRDLLQIADENIKIRIPKTKSGKTEVEDYYAKDVLETMQVTPTQFIELKALMGDTSDNIPGVPKIGPKTATDLMVAYGSLENIYAHLDEISKKSVRETLREHRDLADLSKILATIEINADIPYTLEQARYTNPFTKDAYLLFKKLEFKNLLNKFEKDAVNENNEKDNFKLVTDFSQVEDIFNLAKSKEYISFYTLEDNNKKKSGEKEFVGLSLCLSKEEVYIIPVEGFLTKGYLCSKLKELAQCVKLISFDIKQQYSYLEAASGRGYFDVLIGAYLCNPLKNDYSIVDIASEYLGLMISDRNQLLEKNSIKQALEEKTDKFIEYAGFISYVSYMAMPEIKNRLEKEGMLSLFEEIEMPLSFVLYRMEREGVKVEKEALKEYGDALLIRIEKLENAVYEQAGEKFNLNSPKQLGEILFGKLQLPGGKKTKTGYSTAADVLEKLAPDYPMIADILEYRTLAKLKSTYADGLGTCIEEDGKIHTTFNQTITATGRISSTEPNLQNIPMRMELGRQIRKVFVPKEDYVFVDADYSQIELRLLAHMSEDERLIDAYKQDSDIHRITASNVFHIPMEEVTDLQRRNAKAVNFGIVYGISSFGLSQDLSISRKEAAQYIDKYFETYPGVKVYLDRLVSEGKEQGYVTTLFGRKRPIPELSSSNFMQRSFGERVAMNSPLQGTAADIMKIAMIRVFERMEKEQLKSKMILQVHDEILIEAAKEEVETVTKILEEEMKGAAGLAVTLEVDIHSGTDWYEAK
ncbi:MAG: DNA polymerase I [Lachnospiraceae bacterium]|nr:DNA polymerase I [Lachnospiraceae bacterium]